MKKTLTLIAILSLTGCSTVQGLWDSYFMAKFDANEYQYATSIRTEAQLANCSDRSSMTETATKIYQKASELRNYTQYIPRNEPSFNMAVKLHEEAKSLNARYQSEEKISEAYCKQKIKIVERSANEIQHAFGSKPR